MSKQLPCEIDAKTGEVSEYPPQKAARYRAKLDTLQDIKREMAKVYREARSGMLDVSDSAKLIYVLQQVAKVTIDGDIEKRLEVLEKQHESD